MRDHDQDHPLQRDLAIRIAAAGIAEKRLDVIRGRERDLRARTRDVAAAADAARAALREAAGAHAAGEGDAKAVELARKALRDADLDNEAAAIEAEGIAGVIARAERDLASKRRDLSLAGVAICELEVSRTEALARDVFITFANIMRRRHQLAKLAAGLAGEAAGRVSEPIRYSDERCGLLELSNGENLLSLLEQRGLTGTFAPFGGLEPAQLSELLDIQLPRVAGAAE